MKKLFFAAIAALMLTSCSKNTEDLQPQVGINLTVGFKVLGQWVTINIGNGGGYYYDYNAYQNYGYGPSAQGSTAVVYILNAPTNSTSIPVYVRNSSGNFVTVGTADCTNGVTWQVANYQLSLLQNWFIQHPGVPCAMLVDIDPRYTNGPLSMHLRF